MISLTRATVHASSICKHPLRTFQRHPSKLRLLLAPPVSTTGRATTCRQRFVFFSSSASPSSFPPVDDGAGQPSLVGVGHHHHHHHGGVHDVGGLESLLGETIDLSDPALQVWEQETHALLIVLVQNGYFTTDELRRHIESMSSLHYVTRSYYCKWATSMALGLLERGVISYSDLDDQLLGSVAATSSHSSSLRPPEFTVGQRVRVKSEHSMTRWRIPHLRSPGYIFGVIGIVDSYEGSFSDPSYKAFRSMLLQQQAEEGADAKQHEVERKEHLYRVRFSQTDVWPEGKGLWLNHHSANDTVTVEIYENWLQHDDRRGDDKAASTWESDPTNVIRDSQHNPTAHDHHHHHDDDHDHHHDHDHDHDHEHLTRLELEQRAVDLEVSSSHSLCFSTGSISSHDETATAPVIVGDRLSAALIALLSQPHHLGITLRGELRRIIDVMESIRLRADGTTLVVKAWLDPAFEQRLLTDATSAAREWGIQTTNATTPTKLKVVKSELPSSSSSSDDAKKKNHPGIHNVITCTLCSCYPLSLLGLSPKWYKSRSYRARAVREPRMMLRDSFGLDLPSDQWIIRVHDSTADLRYLVLPPRPTGTENWTEEELRQLVTRDTMIGVALPKGVIAS
jgi:nitrile hydratase subunit alpha